MDRVIGWFGRRRGTTAAAVAGYFVLVCISHDVVQDAAYAIQWTFGRALWSPVVLGLAVAGAAWLTWRAERSLRRGAVPGLARAAWWGVLGLTAASTALLLSTSMEAIHFLQYGLLAVPVLALARRFGTTVVLVSVLGAADEWYQYAVLHRFWGVPFDMNDVWLNALGAAGGAAAVLAFGSCRPREHAAPPRGLWVPLLVALLVFAVGAQALLLGGLLALYPEDAGPDTVLLLSRSERPPSRWNRPDWGRPYHEMHPGTSLALCLLLAGAACALDLRVRPPG